MISKEWNRNKKRKKKGIETPRSNKRRIRLNHLKTLVPKDSPLKLSNLKRINLLSRLAECQIA